MKGVVLQPCFKVLNAGKCRSGSKVSIHNLAPEQTQNVPREADVSHSAAMVCNWLAKESSPLRSLLQIMSYGGLFYAGAVSEKVCRAGVSSEGGKISMEEWVQAAKRRAEQPAESMSESQSSQSQDFAF